MNFMKKIFKLCFFISLGIVMSCSNIKTDPHQKDENTIDSVLEEKGEKVKDVNEGIREGFEESKDELQNRTEELLTDSIAP